MLSISNKYADYSDEELQRIVDEAVKAHDEAFTSSNLPKSEERLVFILAKVGMYRDLAGDVVKREKMDMEVDDLLRLARDWEAAYYRQRKEQKERVRSYQDYGGDEGDIIVSTLQRPSLRTGKMSPLHGNRPPRKPVLNTPVLLENGRIRVSWDRIRDEDFRKLYLYRSTGDPNVSDDSTEIYSSSDITKTYYDDNVSAGDYFYRLYVEDLHEERTSSLVVMKRKT